MAAKRPEPIDRVLRARLREPIRFVDLTERLALKLSAVPSYTARVHFGVWHRQIGMPDFRQLTGVFTPLVFVELEATDVRLEPRVPLCVAGESFLAKSLDAAGAVRHIVREGHHAVSDQHGTLVARACLKNVFTRYDPDPARRRVTELPAALGLGRVPSRVTEVPALEAFVPVGRRPDFVDPEVRTWHYGQTDPNHHVSGMEYLRVVEEFVSSMLAARGQDLRRLYFARARIVYRKPCFRGEGYRRVAWFRGEAPPVIVGAVVKADDPPDARPAVSVELTLLQHEPAEP